MCLLCFFFKLFQYGIFFIKIVLCEIKIYRNSLPNNYDQIYKIIVYVILMQVTN